LCYKTDLLRKKLKKIKKKIRVDTWYTINVVNEVLMEKIKLEQIFKNKTQLGELKIWWPNWDFRKKYKIPKD